MLRYRIIFKGGDIYAPQNTLSLSFGYSTLKNQIICTLFNLIVKNKIKSKNIIKYFIDYIYHHPYSNISNYPIILIPNVSRWTVREEDNMDPVTSQTSPNFILY